MATLVVVSEAFAQRVGTVFKDCDACPEMVVIPAGSFMIGSPASEPGRDSDEGPQHLVTIASQFAAGKFEVTFDEWDACVRESGCGHNPGDAGWGRGRRPVMNVSWDDAKQYVQWLSRKTGRNYCSRGLLFLKRLMARTWSSSRNPEPCLSSLSGSHWQASPLLGFSSPG
ncbi:MAG: formylglycine-generating enzyme family protein [Gammaproteobacteria bacterium]|nr:formylglycine-generating enzyme family protein [Gammaproteobacteria bacterium]